MKNKEEPEYSILRLFLDDFVQIDIYFAKKGNPAMELFLTGGKYFNRYMKKRAASLGFKLTNTQLMKIKK